MALEQTLVDSVHRTVDSLAQTIVDRGLPFNASVTFSWDDGTFLSQSLSIRDGDIETSGTSDEDTDPELTEDRVREIIRFAVEAELYKHTVATSDYYFVGNPAKKLLTFNAAWDLVSSVEQRLQNQINQLKATNTPWWKWWLSCD